MPRASRARIDRFARTEIDMLGELPDGTMVRNPDELRAALLADPVPFVQNVTERLIMYALGRVIEAHDMPFVRDIVRESAADDYRFSTLITNIVLSDEFTEGAGAGSRRRRPGDQAGRSQSSKAESTMFITQETSFPPDRAAGRRRRHRAAAARRHDSGRHRAGADRRQARRRAWASSISRTAPS